MSEELNRRQQRKQRLEALIRKGAAAVERMRELRRAIDRVWSIERRELARESRAIWNEVGRAQARLKAAGLAKRLVQPAPGWRELTAENRVKRLAEDFLMNFRMDLYYECRKVRESLEGEMWDEMANWQTACEDLAKLQGGVR